MAQLTRNIDRRLVVLAFSALLIVSGSLVAFAPNYLWLMVGRALLGLAIGGFWGMSTSIIMRLVPTEDVPRGLAMLNAGNAIAATISAPLGSYLGDIIGWRGAFFFVVPLAVLAFVWQWIALPSLPSRHTAGQGNVFRLLKRPQVALGMASITLLSMGQFGWGSLASSPTCARISRPSRAFPFPCCRRSCSSWDWQGLPEPGRLPQRCATVYSPSSSSFHW